MIIDFDYFECVVEKIKSFFFEEFMCVIGLYYLFFIF